MSVTTLGHHLRIVHALLDDIGVGSQILDAFAEFPTKHLDLGGSVTPGAKIILDPDHTK